MNLKFRKLFLLAFVLNIPCAWSQNQNRSVNVPELKYGVTFGASTGKISGLESTIISEPYFTNYTLTQTKKIGYQGGLFVHYSIDETPLALYGEASYLQQATNLRFLNEQTNFGYDMTFNYAYANILGMLKVYPWMKNSTKFLNGFHVGLGPHVGFVTSDRIVYDSHHSGLPEFGEDSYQSQQLERVLKAKTDFGATAEIGYMIPSIWIDIAIRGRYSFTDAVEALPNSYNFIDNHNRSMFLQVVFKLDLSDL